MPGKKNVALEIAQQALRVLSPPLASLVELTTDSVARSGEVAKSGGLEELHHEAERQELTMRMAERHAKVAQELALARRIETAQEVEMEEFYDLSGSGTLGVRADGAAISAGLGASGQRVTKRIFRFKGLLHLGNN